VVAFFVLKPLQKENRIDFLDSLRGIAILFIFLVNLLSFSAWESYPAAIRMEATNEGLHYLIDLLLKQKWYSIFSILFGIGFAIQFNNIKVKGADVNRVFSRRMLGLLILGLLHMFLLWVGDILALYALLGFVLLLFKNLRSRDLLIIAAISLFLPLFHFFLLQVSGNFYPLKLNEYYATFFTENSSPFHERIYTTSLFEYWSLNIKLTLLRLSQFLLDGRFFKVFACFLLGLVLGREILKSKLLKNTKLLKRITFIGLPLGLLANIIPLEVNVGYLGTFFWNAIGVVPLALTYFSLIALAFNKRPDKFNLFAPVGKMALSNYLLQSVFGILFFCNLGFGYMYYFNLPEILLIGIAFYLLQIFLSAMWLRNFKFGPLEWLWRCWTYKKWISIKTKY
jgi:uncharacterized protein